MQRSNSGSKFLNFDVLFPNRGIHKSNEICNERWREIQTSRFIYPSTSSVNIVRADARDKHHWIWYNSLSPWQFVSFVREWEGGDSFEIAANNHSRISFSNEEDWAFRMMVAIILLWKISLLASQLRSILNPLNVISYGLFSSSSSLSSRICVSRNRVTAWFTSILLNSLWTLENVYLRDGER